MRLDKNAMIRLIVPMLLEQILIVTMGFADTFMVAGVGEAAVSGVSLVDSLNVLVQQILVALAAGGAVVTSQYIGKQNKKQAAKSAAQLYLVVMISTITLMLIGMLFSRSILRFIFGKIDSDVMHYSTIYFLISTISFPFMGIYSSGTALFRAQGNSKISMFSSLVMNVINLTGNAILIYGFHMGVLGAALATLTGRIFAALWVAYAWQKKQNEFRINNLSDMKPDGGMLKKILRLGIPAGLENGMFHIGKICVISLVSTLGTASIAADAVANSLAGIAHVPGNTISMATIPIIGQLLGAGDKEGARKYAKGLMLTAVIGLAISNSIMFIGIPYITRLYTLSPEATSICIKVFRWFNIFSIFAWVGSFAVPNIIRAGGDAKFTMTASILSMWVCRVCVSYLLVKHFHMGLLGVWFGMFSDWCVRSMAFIVRFCGNKWMEHKVI